MLNNIKDSSLSSMKQISEFKKKLNSYSKWLQIMEFFTILPVNYSLFLMNGVKYNTGSDYNNHYLKMSVEELQEMEDEKEELINEKIRDEEYRWGEDKEDLLDN